MTGATIDDSELLRLSYADLDSFLRVIATGAEGSRLMEADGVTSAISPAGRYSSLVNSSTYADPAAMADALPRLAETYIAAGIQAWGVWANDTDTELREALTAAGLKLDSTPRAMGAPVSELRLRPGTPEGLRIDETWNPATFSAVNESAYGLPGGSFARVFSDSPATPGITCFTVWDSDEAVATAVTCHEPDGDCGVFMVATLKERHGQGLGRVAMEAALRHAIHSGCTSTTLQGSTAGQPLYRSLGYRDLGHAIELWEHRQPR